jgi:hypothetical protein
MYGIVIEVLAVSRFHEPKPYDFFAGLEVDVYSITGGTPEVKTLLAHACEDIMGLSAYPTKDDALVAARAYLGDNATAITEAAISKYAE